MRLTPHLAEDLAAAPLTYTEVGATAGALPAGYHHLRLSAPVGDGPGQFEAAAHALLTWQAQEQAGLQPQVSSPHVRQGSVAVLRLGLGALALSAPVRVVERIDQPRRQGFVHGTLPGHPVAGEESFTVTLAREDTVAFHLVALSRAARWFTLLGGPATRAGQRLVAERYLKAVRAAARSGRSRYR